MPGQRRIPHCTGCHRPCRGHPGPIGKKCPIFLAAREEAARNRQLSSIIQTPATIVMTTFAPVMSSQAGQLPLAAAASSSVSDSINASSALNVVPIMFPGEVLSHGGAPSYEGAQSSAPNTPTCVTVTMGNVDAPPVNTSRFVEQLLPGPGVDLTTSFNPPVSSAPPVTVNTGASVHEVNTIRGPIPTAPLPTQAAPLMHLYTTHASQVQYAHGSVASFGAPGAPAPPVYSGHPIPSPLWQGHSAPNVPYSAPYSVPYGHPGHANVVFAQSGPPSNPVRPTGAVPFGAPVAGAIGSQFVSNPYSAAYPTNPSVISTAAGGSFTVAPPTCVVIPGVHPPAPVYTYSAAPPTSTHYWGGTAQVTPTSVYQANPTTVYQPVQTQANTSTNSIHPGAQNARHYMDIGLEFLDQRSVEAAINGECVALEDFLQNASIENDELRSNIDFMGNLQVKSVKTKKSIGSVLKWLEAWVAYEMVLCKFYGYTVYYEMARYRAFIIGISQKYKFAAVAAYDLRHRQRLAHAGSFLFSSVDHDLYVTIFDMGAVKSAGRCTRCGSGDHNTSECGKSSGSSRGNSSRSRGQNRRKNGNGKGEKSEICYNFQSGSCSWGGSCFRLHKCAGCGGDSSQASCGNPGCKAAYSRNSGTAAST